MQESYLMTVYRHARFIFKTILQTTCIIYIERYSTDNKQQTRSKHIERYKQQTLSKIHIEKHSTNNM